MGQSHSLGDHSWWLSLCLYLNLTVTLFLSIYSYVLIYHGVIFFKALYTKSCIICSQGPCANPNCSTPKNFALSGWGCRKLGQCPRATLKKRRWLNSNIGRRIVCQEYSHRSGYIFNLWIPGKPCLWVACFLFRYIVQLFHAADLFCLYCIIIIIIIIFFFKVWRQLIASKKL